MSVLLLSAAMSILPVLSHAQMTASASSSQAPFSSLQPLRDGASHLAALQRPVSVDFSEVPLRDALHTIAKQGELGLSYSPSLIPDGQPVELHLKDGTVLTALSALLQGTELRAFVSSHEEIVILRSTASQRGQAPMRRVAVQKMRTRGVVPVTPIEKTITGRVTDAQTGDTIPGVNVVVPGTTIGTATDPDGAYSLDVPDDADSLRFTAVGYESRTVAIGERSVVNVELSPDVAALEEVLVVGYGTQRAEEITGSVASVSAQDVQDLSVASFQDALQGQLAGLEVRQTSGAPGASPQVRVRGTNSITAGNGPLYVIDGLPLSADASLQGGIARRRSSFQPPSQNPLATLNTRDIESIEVLKDASAAAIYGSRGSNGVVIVTTKQGREDGLRVRYSGAVGTQEAINVPDMMNSQELVDFTIDARNNNYVEKFGAPPPNPRTNEGRPSEAEDPFVRIPPRYIAYDQGEVSTDTDWLGLILEDGAATWNSTLSASGGREGLTYYLSGGIQQQNGIISGSAFDRYTLHAGLDSDLTDRFRVGADLNLSLSQQDRKPASAPYFARPPGIVYSAMVHSPVVPPFEEDGSFNQRGPEENDAQSFLEGGTTSASNPLAIQEAVGEDLDHHRTFGTTFVEADLGLGLTAKTLFGADLSDYTRSFFRGRELLYRTSAEPEPYAQSNSARSFNWLLENTLQYQNTFGGVHNLNALAGITAQEERNDFNQIFAENFPINDVPTISGGQVTNGTSIAEEWSLLSALSRVNYDYDSRYLFSVALRADKASRFGPDNRTGIFPSASAGWRIGEEAFMEAVPQVSALKLRLSYGQTGNFQIPNYGSFSNLGFQSYVAGTQNVLTGVQPETLGDPGLTWETTEEVNLGLDVGLFDDRVTLEADAYRSVTSDLLLNVSVPGASGYETVLTNIGEVENTGLELFLQTQNLTGAFEWSTSLNFSTNRNEVTALGPGNAEILSRGAAGIRHITRVGDPIGSYYGYVVDGIYQSEAEIQSAPEDTQAPDPGPGDFRFKDINGDGQITPDDRTVTGNYQPDFTYGITNRFSYRNFDLRVFLQGVEGREILNLTARHMKNGEANFNSYAVFNDRWRSPEEPGNGSIPRADRQTGLHGNNNRPSSFQVEDGSFLNIREITLGYTFQLPALNTLTRQVRVYASGQNLHMFTDYIGFNPMVSLQTGDELTPGQDYGAYPLQRTYTVGVDLTF